jgi:5-formyltetrahydrofolate cyclo-ligase
MAGSSASPDEVQAWRRGERERLIAARMTMPLEERQAASEDIARHLEAAFPPSGFGMLGAYWPFRREWDCLPFLRDVIAAGGRAALPVVVARRQPLEFRPWTPEARMEAGVWNILHPADGPAVRPEALLIPLVGFDPAGYRLGYGAGYYDRTLATFDPLPMRIGVGFERQRMPTIQPQPHDIPMDVIITEAGLLRPAVARV